MRTLLTWVILLSVTLGGCSKSEQNVERGILGNWTSVAKLNDGTLSRMNMSFAENHVVKYAFPEVAGAGGSSGMRLNGTWSSKGNLLTLHDEPNKAGAVDKVFKVKQPTEGELVLNLLGTNDRISMKRMTDAEFAAEPATARASEVKSEKTSPAVSDAPIAMAKSPSPSGTNQSEVPLAQADPQGNAATEYIYFLCKPAHVNTKRYAWSPSFDVKETQVDCDATPTSKACDAFEVDASTLDAADGFYKSESEETNDKPSKVFSLRRSDGVFEQTVAVTDLRKTVKAGECKLNRRKVKF